MKCRKLPNGKWECYAEGPRDPITNKRNAIRKQSAKKTVAQRKVQEALEALQSGIDGRKAHALSFHEVATDWLQVYSMTGVKKSTLRSRQSSLKTLAPYLSDLAIGRITHQVIQDMLTDLYKKGVSKSTLDHAKVTANFVFKHAQKQSLRMDNPVDHTVIPKKRQTVDEIERTEIEEKYFDRQELESFLKTAVSEGLVNDAEWAHLAAFTGCRIGEICALKWTDVFFDSKQIRITKTLDNAASVNSYELTPPKTARSIRSIDVDDRILTMLKRLKTKQAENRLKYKAVTPDYHDGNFVFCRPKTGYPYSRRDLYRRCLRLCEKAGLSKIDGPHILRHTHITMLTEAGVELNTIMNRVGHSDARTTKNIYTHITNHKKKDAAAQVNFHYGDIFEAYLER